MRPVPRAGRTPALRAAIAVGVVALAIGWVLGRASEPRTAPTATTPAASEPPTAVDETLPSVEATAPGSPAPATSTTLTTAPPEPPIAVDARVTGLPARVIAYAAGEQLVELDLATGTAARRVVERQPFGPVQLYAGRDWVLLPSFDPALPSTLLMAGRPARLVDLGTAPQIVGLAGTDVIDGIDGIWRLVDASGAATTVEIVGLDGEPTDVAIELPVAPVGVDPAGGLVVEVPGGTYTVGTDSPARLTGGKALAIGSGQLLAFECDDELACALHLVDRATGERERVAGGVPGRDLAPAPIAMGGSALAPDGSAAIVLWVAPGGTSLGVLELGDGSFTELLPGPEVAPVAWSPDGRFVFHLRGGRIVAFDRERGDTVDVASGVVAVAAFAVVDLAP